MARRQNHVRVYGVYVLKQVNPADGDTQHASAKDALTQKGRWRSLKLKLPPLALVKLPAVAESQRYRCRALWSFVCHQEEERASLASVVPLMVYNFFLDVGG